jgi:hypothetical protein
MNRREFLKLAAAVPVLLWVPPIEVLASAPDYCSRVRLTGLGRESALGSVTIYRVRPEPFYTLLHQPINTWGGIFTWEAPPGAELIWTPDIKVRVQGLAVASIGLRDRELRYGPHGLISTYHYLGPLEP